VAVVGAHLALCRLLYGLAVKVRRFFFPLLCCAFSWGLALPSLGEDGGMDATEVAPAMGDAGIHDEATDSDMLIDAGPQGNAASDAGTSLDFQPPVALVDTAIPFPEGAPRVETPTAVVVQLQVDAQGDVIEVALIKSMGEPFDAAVLKAVRDFKFQPGLYQGTPVPVKIEFSQTFESPPKPKFPARVEGVILERGTQLPVAFAEIVFTTPQGQRSLLTDAKGRFALDTPAASMEVKIYADGFGHFKIYLVPQKGEALQVRLLLDRDEDLANTGDNAYVTRVKKKRIRTETVRETLTGDEMRHIPGTFGDPYRAVTNLPGMTETSAFLPLPLIRGSSPGSTGILFDSMRLPYLFHLLPGPTVVHPRIIDSIDFYPGAFPLRFGGYTAGIVDGQSQLLNVQKNTTEIDINAVQTGVFGEYVLGDSGVTLQLGGRYGYPAFLLSLIAPGFSLGYWDYQGRLDYGPKNNHWTLNVFGAADSIELERDNPDGEIDENTGLVRQELQELFRMDFHRLDLRHRRGSADHYGDYRVALGYDRTRFDGEDYGVESPIVHPRATWRLPMAESLALNMGTEVLYRESSYNEAPEGEEGLGVTLFNSVFEQAAGTLVQGGLYAEAEWMPRDDFLLVGGSRSDVYHHRDKQAFTFDPRLTARYRLYEPMPYTTWMFGGVGLYHQPPRLFLPFPGVDHSGIEDGLLRSIQSTVGAEIDLSDDVEFKFQTYYHHMDPVFFELTVNPTFESLQNPIPDSPPGELPAASAKEGEEIDLGTVPRDGRAYGIEFLLRKRISEGYFGWVAYTLGRSERLIDDRWLRYDFDRTHVMKIVGGKRLPRNWSVSGRISYMSGTPTTTVHGYNTGTKTGAFRIDLRFDKRVVWDQWLFEYYVDLANAGVTPEDFGFGTPNNIPYVLPTVGMKAIF